MRLDSHQHFWHYHPVKDGWIPDRMSMIRRDFLPAEVWPSMQRNRIDGGIAVQADQSEQETMFLLELARRYGFIKGVVGWIDLRAADLDDRLHYFSQFPMLRGFRHIVQAETRIDYLLDATFCRGIALLARYGYTYDILIYPRHLEIALEFVRRFPGQRFVIDHLAKPEIRVGRLEPWQRQIRAFAPYENVYCKIAGLVTEAGGGWKVSQFRPYMDIVLETFGPMRVMFGSDWPVCLPDGSYDDVCGIVEQCLPGLSELEAAKLWSGNCSRFYNL